MHVITTSSLHVGTNVGTNVGTVVQSLNKLSHRNNHNIFYNKSATSLAEVTSSGTGTVEG